MSTILERLKQTDAAMKDDTHMDQLGFLLKDAAIKAMMAGIDSDEWKSYMSLFADNEKQLTLLTVPVAGEESYLTEARAYIVANSICGADSTTQTSLRVDPRVDDNLLGDSDGSIVDPGGNGEFARPFLIP